MAHTLQIVSLLSEAALEAWNTEDYEVGDFLANEMIEVMNPANPDMTRNHDALENHSK